MIENLEVIEAQIERMESHVCSEKTIAIRKRTLSNDTTAHYRQCMECGRAPGAVKKPTQGICDDFDENLKDQRWRDLARLKEIRKEMQRAIDSDAWHSAYIEYRKTQAWRDKKNLVMKRSRGLCEGCGIKSAEVVHHITYDHVGHVEPEGEFLFELLAVCISCHSRIHKKKV